MAGYRTTPGRRLPGGLPEWPSAPMARGMKRLYSDAAYRPGADPGNLWQSTIATPSASPPNGEGTAEVAVIGAGFTGLQAALRLAADHEREVVVVDAAWPGWGASGRNGGFCCLGGTKLSIPQIRRRTGPAGAAAFCAAQLEAIDFVAETLDRFGIDADRTGSGEILAAHRPRDFAGFPEDAAAFRAAYGRPAEVLPPRALAERGIASPAFHGGLHLGAGFGLNPLKYVLGLAEVARAAGVRIQGETLVEAIVPEGRDLVLRTTRGRLRARQVILATNGYSSDGLPDWMTGRYLPALSNILATRPLTAAEQAAQGWTATEIVADTRRLLHYMRLLPDGRFLFGMRGGTSDAPRALAAVHAQLREDFRRRFPAWAGVETPWLWQGLVCLTPTLSAYVGPVPGLPGAFAAFGYHGNGVSMASWAGARVADLAAGTMTPEALPPIIARPPGRFPLPGLRRRFLAPAYAWYGWRDR